MKVFKSKEEQQQSVSQSLGDILKQDREKLGLTVEQVSHAINMRINVIVSIENNTPINLPSPYIKAFIAELNEFYDYAKTDANYLKSIKVNVFVPKKIDTHSQNNKKTTNKHNDTVIQTNKNKLSDTPSIADRKIDSEQEHKNTEEIINLDDSFQIKNNHFTGEKQITDTPKETKPVINAPPEKHKIKASGQTRTKFFNKIIFKKLPNLSVRDVIIYATITLFLFAVIFFIFIYDEASVVVDNKYATNNDTANDSKIITIKDNDMFSYFNENQDIVLRAVCKDTAWVKIEIDNKTNHEMLMKPGMENSWVANKNIILTTSNVGAIAFYKNDTLLPQFGAIGTMVNNIKITQDGIAGVSPLTTGSIPVASDSLRPSQVKIIPSTADTTKIVARRTNNVRRRRKEETQQPIIIDLSAPPSNKSPVLEKKQTEENE